VTKDLNSTKRGPEEEEGEGDGSRVAESEHGAYGGVVVWWWMN